MRHTKNIESMTEEQRERLESVLHGTVRGLADHVERCSSLISGHIGNLENGGDNRTLMVWDGDECIWECKAKDLEIKDFDRLAATLNARHDLCVIGYKQIVKKEPVIHADMESGHNGRKHLGGIGQDGPI
jgi:hypothetical protein